MEVLLVWLKTFAVFALVVLVVLWLGIDHAQWQQRVGKYKDRL